MSDRDPMRLLDADSEAPEVLRSLLESAGNEGPSPAARARLEARLAPLIGLPPAGQAAQGPVTTSAYPAGAATAKIAGGLLLAGAIGIGVWWLTRATPEAPAVEQAPPAAVELVPKLEEVEPPPVASPSGPETKPSAAARPEAAAAPERPAPREESTTEVDLLDEARQALGGNPAKALQLTRLHEQRFPGGVLGQEREVIAIDALSRLGRTAEAKRRAERFNARYPGSAHQSKIDRLITRITQ
jgi:hypothetical protein